MSGHSKWATIKRDKAKNDAARGKVFTKMAREIIVAARLGGPDPENNFRLRTALEKARVEGVPQENIKRAIARGAGSGEGENLEEIQYEGYGPGGVAVVVQAMTDNRNRTAGDVRSYFNKYGGNLGETGCVGWMFETRGVITLSRESNPQLDADTLLLEAAEAGADDVQESDDRFEVLTAPPHLEAVQKHLLSQGLVIEEAEISQLPQNTVTVTDVDLARKLVRLLETLDQQDDVQAVYSNVDFDQDVLEHLDLR